MPLAGKKIRALSQRALCKSANVSAALSEVANLFRSEKVRVQRRYHAKLAQKFHERGANFPEFRRATPTEFSFFQAYMRCADRMTSLKLSTASIVRPDPKKEARGVELTQI